MSKSKIKALLGVFLVIVIMSIPVATATAKSFNNMSTDPLLAGTKLTINKTHPKLDQTIKVKLKLKVDGHKAAAGLTQYASVFVYDPLSNEDIWVEDYVLLGAVETVTDSKGRATFILKLSDFAPWAASGTPFIISCIGYPTQSHQNIGGLEGTLWYGWADIVVK